MNAKSLLIILSAGTIALSSCSKIIQDEVGVKRTFGKLSPTTLSPGLRFYNPFASTIMKVPVRTINLQIAVGLPSKEGLTIQSEISILYSVKKEEVPKILETVGLGFQEILILPVFRSASADVCARFYAKDMHSSERARIEREIKEKMMDVLSERGFNIEAVLMKSITLPPSLSKAIEDKLSAEQEALRMEFILDRERKEAERRSIEAEGKKNATVIAAEADKKVTIIGAEGAREASILEAEGINKANELLNKSLLPNTLKYYQIEAFKNLCASPNAKTIITDGKTPFLNIPD